MAKSKSYFKRFLILLACLSLNSCYTPDKFTAEVVIDKTGRYIITYVGDLIWAPLMREINLGLIDKEDIPKKIANVRRDLMREPNFQEITSKGNGRFFVKYKRMGKITGTESISFVRGNNSPIMKISTNMDEITTFTGAYLTPPRAKQLVDAGIPIDGVFRVITDAPVLSQNAMTVMANDKGGGKIYEWEVNRFDGIVPKLSLQIKFNEFDAPDI